MGCPYATIVHSRWHAPRVVECARHGAKFFTCGGTSDTSRCTVYDEDGVGHIYCFERALFFFFFENMRLWLEHLVVDIGFGRVCLPPKSRKHVCVVFQTQYSSAEYWFFSRTNYKIGILNKREGWKAFQILS